MNECTLEKRPDGIALITLNRPERMNAVDNAMSTLLSALIEDCEQDRAVRCVILTGAGRAFCSGGDAKGMETRIQTGTAADLGLLATIDDRIRSLRQSQNSSVIRLHTMYKPTVAVINGAAIGAGLSYALSCDIRLMSDQAKLSAGFAKMGLSGDMGGTYFLSKLVNTSIARELCFMSVQVDAARALQLGLVNQVFPQASLMDEALAYCLQLAQGPTAAFGRIKENLNYASAATLQEGLDFEARNMVLNSISVDHKEAVRAFRAKEQPKFCGA